jgi:hypothetical protein
MEIGLAVILLVTVLISYVIIQETRARLHWRGLVREGDLSAITALTEGQLSTWKAAKVPKGTPLNVWRGVQSTEILAIATDSLHVSCSAEGLYALIDGVRKETSSPLAEGITTTARLADMVLYEIPDVKFDRVRIDVYSTFRTEGGASSQRCILTTTATREVAEDLEWEALSPEEIVNAFGGRFELNEDGVALPLEVDAPVTAQGVSPASAA